jgi:hypothetical protein
VSAVWQRDINRIRIELAIDTDNPAFLGLLVPRPALCCVRLVGSRMVFAVKQLDTFRFLVSQGTIDAPTIAIAKFISNGLKPLVIEANSMFADLPTLPNVVFVELPNERVAVNASVAEV